MNFLKRLFGDDAPIPENAPSDAAANSSDETPPGDLDHKHREAREALRVFCPTFSVQQSLNLERMQPGLGSVFIEEGTGVGYMLNQVNSGHWLAQKLNATVRQEMSSHAEIMAVLEAGANGDIWTDEPAPTTDSTKAILGQLFPDQFGADLKYLCWGNERHGAIMRMVYSDNRNAWHETPAGEIMVNSELLVTPRRITWHSLKPEGAPTTQIVIQVEVGEESLILHERDNATGVLTIIGTINALPF